MPVQFRYEDANVEFYGFTEDEIKTIKELISLYDKLGERNDLMYNVYLLIGSIAHNLTSFGKAVNEDIRGFLEILRDLGKNEKIKYVRIKDSSTEIEIFLHEYVVVIFTQTTSGEIYNMLNEVEERDILTLIAAIIREVGFGGW